MKSYNIANKQLLEAIRFLRSELPALPLPDTEAPDALKTFLEEFARHKTQGALQGQVLFERARFEATVYANSLSGSDLLSPFNKIWLAYLLSRALLIACGCYKPNAPERDWHWKHYKPLLALFRDWDYLNTAQLRHRECPWSSAFVLPAITFSLN